MIPRRRQCPRLALFENALSPNRCPGVVRGRSGPRRRIRIPAITCSNAIESCRCPAIVTRDTGRARESPASTILVLSPPRDRPRASRPAATWPGFVIRLIPLCGRVGCDGHQRRAGGHGPRCRPPRPSSPGPRAGRTHGATRRGCPPTRPRPPTDSAGCRSSSNSRTQKEHPATTHPPASATTPWMDHQPMIHPPTTPTRRPIRQQRLQPRPLLIRQIMPIKHDPVLPKHSRQDPRDTL